MRKMLVNSLAAAALSFAIASAALGADPTVHQIYQAASSGHLDEAQQMMDQVLRTHPESAKAHYVQSELYAREGKLALARTELNRAEQLAPGLPNENPRSVAELKAELGLTRGAVRSSGVTRESGPLFPWRTVLILAAVVAVIWMLFRRRSYAQSASGGAPTTAPGSYGPGGYGAAGPAGGGGIGSTVAGGLAGGLAAGAGIVAGEALAHRFLEGEQRGAPPARAEDGDAANSDMGGADFGVDDPGSWDDGSGGGGGGDDWT